MTAKHAEFAETRDLQFRFFIHSHLVAHDCGYPLSRYTCRATRVAADFLDFIALCRCSTGVALHPPKILVSHLAPPHVPGGVAPKFGSEKVSRYTGVSQLQLRVSRYTVQLSTLNMWDGRAKRSSKDRSRPFLLPRTLLQNLWGFAGGFCGRVCMAEDLVLTKGWFPKGWFRRMFPRNENRNEGTFAKTTLLETALLSPNDPFWC